MPQHGSNLGQGAERQRGRTRSEWRCNKDGSGRRSKRPGDETVRWRRTESEHSHRPGIAMIGLVKQLAFGRAVTRKQRMDPILVRGAAAVVTLAVTSRSRQGRQRLAVRHIGLGRGCVDRVNSTVHLAQRRPQHHGQGQQAHQPAHHPDFTQAGATASGCWTAVCAQAGVM